MSSSQAETSNPGACHYGQAVRCCTAWCTQLGRSCLSFTHACLGVRPLTSLLGFKDPSQAFSENQDHNQYGFELCPKERRWSKLLEMAMSKAKISLQSHFVDVCEARGHARPNFAVDQTCSTALLGQLRQDGTLGKARDLQEFLKGRLRSHSADEQTPARNHCIIPSPTPLAFPVRLHLNLHFLCRFIC